MTKDSRKKAHPPMRFVEKTTRNNRRTGHDALPFYIGVFGNNLQFSFGFFQKELAVFVRDRRSVAPAIRAASHPGLERTGRFESPRSIFQNSADPDYPDVSIEKTSDRRRRYPLPQMEQTHFWRLPLWDDCNDF